MMKPPIPPFPRRWPAGLAVVLLGLLCSPPARPATLEDTFNQALIAEEGRGDYETARAGYEDVVRQLDSQRRLAATAVFRLGEVYRKLGRTNDAVVQYHRVLRQFPEEAALAELSRQNLAGLGRGGGGGGAAEVPGGEAGKSGAREESRESLTGAELEEIRRIKALTANSPDLLNAPDGEGRTPLQDAASKGHLAVVKYLLEAGALVDVGDVKFGESALQFAVRGGHLAVALALLDAGAAVDGTALATPLHSAAARGYTRIVQTLVERGAKLQVARIVIVKGPRTGGGQVTLTTTPLGVAAFQERIDMVKLLLDLGADPDFCEGEGCALPIDLTRSEEVLSLLLDRGADARLAGVQLQNAVRTLDLRLVRRLLEAGTPAASPGSAALREALFPEGAEWAVGLAAPGVGAAASEPEASLPAGPRREVADLLVKHGADVNPLLLRIVRELPAPWLRWAIAHGADLSRSNPTESFFEALGLGDFNFTAGARPADVEAKVRLLVSHGADPTQPFRSGQSGGAGITVLHALTRQFTPSLLGEAKVDVNVPDSNGRTPLMWAAAAGNAEAVEWLLARGAEVNIQDRDGATALHFAAANPHLGIVKRLLAANADPSLRVARTGQTPGSLVQRPPQRNGMWPIWNSAPMFLNSGSEVAQEELLKLLPPPPLEGSPRGGRVSFWGGVVGQVDVQRGQKLPLSQAFLSLGKASGGLALRQVVLRRPGATNAEPTVVEVNLEAVLSGTSTNDPLLHAGDRVEIRTLPY